MAQPFSCFTKNLGIIYAAIFPADACEAAGDDWGVGTLIGTGPYILGEHDNSSVTLDKNPEYWGSEPHFDQIIVTRPLLEADSGTLHCLPADAHIVHEEMLLTEDSKYHGLKLNRTYVGPKYYGGFSDHLPVVLLLRY